MSTQRSRACAVATAASMLICVTSAAPLANEGNQTLPVVAPETSDSGGLSTTAVVVIVVGVVVVLALLGWLYRLTCKKNNNKKTNAAAEDAYVAAQQALEKSHEFHDEFATHYVDIVPENAPKMQAPRPTKGASGRPSGFPRASRPAGEPALYNRELSSQGNNDSTRSYLHDLVTPAENVTDRNPKIFASMNSVDFAYPDTDRSIAFSVTSDNYGQGDSSRSHDITDSYGFMIDSSRSSGMYVDDEGDTVPSLRPVDRGVAMSNEPDPDVDTSELTTQQRRQIQVEI